MLSFFFLMIRRPPRSTLFPYTDALPISLRGFVRRRHADRVTPLKFEILATDGAARRGRLTTAHGVVDTPVFMPVGTQATVKALTPEDLETAGEQVVHGNTYQLMISHGTDV